MTKSYQLLAAMCTVALGAGGAACSAPRPSERPEHVVTREVVGGDLLTAGQTVRVAAEVEGDVAAAANRVTIAAPVDGYVLSAGRVVTLEAPIENDVWAAGEIVEIDSRVGNNANVAGRRVYLSNDSVIVNNARLAGEHVRLDGRVQEDLRVGASAVEIAGDIGGEVRANAGRVTLLPGAVVHGNLIVESPQPPEISPEAQVLGQVEHRAPERESWFGWPMLWLVMFLSLLVLGLVAVAMSPAWAARVSDVMRSRTLRSMLMGLLVLVVVPIGIAALLVTVIGIPLALVILGLYIVALILSAVFVSYRVGSWLLARFHRPDASRWAALVVGALVVSLGMSLPAVGWLIALIVVLTGAGALALERRDARAHLRGAGAL